LCVGRRLHGSLTHFQIIRSNEFCRGLGLVIGRFYQSSWSPGIGMFYIALLIDFALAVGLTIIVSWISWIALEQPLLKLKNKFCYQTGHADN
jgi:hypothetical protein